MDKELNENLLKAVGFTYDIPSWGGKAKYWLDPRGYTHGSKRLEIDVTTDFNDCLRWIMPVLREQGIEVVSYFYDSTPLIACDLCPCGASYSTIEGHGETEPLAFCRAAWEFLKEK